MTNLLIFLFIVQCVAVLAWGLKKTERMIQYPFLAAAVYAGWVFPQLVGLANDPTLPGDGLNKTIIMAILCLGAICYGYHFDKRPVQISSWHFVYNRLLIGSATLSLIGSYFFYEMSQLVGYAGMQWSGRITIFHFFSGLMTLGFVIALRLHLSRFSWITFAVIVFNSVLYFERILIAGRRAAMIEFGMIILLALWFKKRWLPPRWTIVSGLLVGALVVNSMVDYRMQTSQQTEIFETDWSQVLAIDYLGNLQRITEEGGQELQNAVYGIEAADQTLDFDFGMSLWNSLIFRYVPAQFVGSDLKDSLMFKLENPAATVFSYRPWIGTTATGFQSTFLSFWYFGAIIFGFIAWVMSRVFSGAMQGNFEAQIVAMLLPVQALHVITHDHAAFFMPFVQWMIFLLPFLLISRVKQPRQEMKFTDSEIKRNQKGLFLPDHISQDGKPSRN